MPKRTTLAEKFWARVVVPKDDEECWIWVGARTDLGYGNILHDGKGYKVHRVSYEIHFEPIPKGMDIDHHAKIQAV